jgi:arsenite-transporting ATPase
VINGVLPKAEAEHDALAAAIWQREQEALANLPAGLSELPTDTLLLQPVNMVGVSALKGLLDTGSEALPLPVTNIHTRLKTYRSLAWSMISLAVNTA